MAGREKKDQHVVPHDGAWAVRSEGRGRATSVYKTQREAIKAARKSAKRDGSEIVIHGRDGRVRERDSYGTREVLFPLTRTSTGKRKIEKAVNEVIEELEKVS